MAHQGRSLKLHDKWFTSFFPFFLSNNPRGDINVSHEWPVQMHNSLLDHMSIMMPGSFCSSAPVRDAYMGERLWLSLWKSSTKTASSYKTIRWWWYVAPPNVLLAKSDDESCWGWMGYKQRSALSVVTSPATSAKTAFYNLLTEDVPQHIWTHRPPS